MPTLPSLNLLLLLLSTASSSSPSTWNASHLVDFHPGNSPIVLSVPHDGHLRPADIADRRASGCELQDGTCDWTRSCQNPGRCRALLFGDPNTAEIAESAVETLTEDGLTPHAVYNRLHRVKMDPNRGGDSLTEGIQTDPKANITYQLYHRMLGQAVQTVKKRFNGRGLLIDIHGQHHKENWTEIGYRLTKSQLNSRNFSSHLASIRGLHSRSGLSLESLIAGPLSFGSILSGFNRRVVPSESVTSPESGGYYRGGFITAAYGSVGGGEFDSLQVEITREILYAGESVRRDFGRNLATAIGIFVRRFYL